VAQVLRIGAYPHRVDDGVAYERRRFEAAGHAYRFIDSAAPPEHPEALAAADAIVAGGGRWDAGTFRLAERCRLFLICAVGLDSVDVEAATAEGIAVCHMPDICTHEVAEHTFALILALRRNIVAYRESVLAGRWQQSGQFCFFDHPIHDLRGSRLGIMGEGVLGQRVAEIARAFGMRVLFSAHKGSTGMGPLYTPFEEVLERADILTLHCPLTPGTKNLLGDAEFRRMSRHPLVINTARGGLIDEAALVRALEAGLISGAAVDAVSAEPPPLDHPFMRLVDRSDFILTPHVGWASLEARQEVADQVTASIEAFAAGQPRNLVAAP